VVFTSPYQLGLLINYTALARINPANGVESVRRDITLDPGWTFSGTILGPDAKPLVGARGFGLAYRDFPWNFAPSKTAEFTVRAFNPRQPRPVFFLYPEKGLVGVASPPKENGGSVVVRMGPGAAVTGRLVDANGKPRVGVHLTIWVHLKEQPYSPGRSLQEHIETDREGRFRIEALLPGYEYHLTDNKGSLSLGGELRSGQTRELGDVHFKRGEE
jgi:hypothetical protein